MKFQSADKVEPFKVWIALSNGDYNMEIDSVDTIDWELVQGGQKWVIVAKRQLSTQEYTKIAEILDNKMLLKDKDENKR